MGALALVVAGLGLAMIVHLLSGGRTSGREEEPET